MPTTKRKKSNVVRKTTPRSKPTPRTIQYGRGFFDSSLWKATKTIGPVLAKEGPKAFKEVRRRATYWSTYGSGVFSDIGRALSPKTGIFSPKSVKNATRLVYYMKPNEWKDAAKYTAKKGKKHLPLLLSLV